MPMNGAITKAALSYNAYANFKLQSEPESPEIKHKKKLRMNKSVVNFHSNFVDLNPDYTAKRSEPIVFGKEKCINSIL